MTSLPVDSSSEIVLADQPSFYGDLHVKYITTLSDKLEASFEGALTSHLRMSGVYWSLTALSILKPPEEVNSLMGLSEKKSQEAILDWVFECFDEAVGGFGGNKNQDGHVLYTLSAIQILALANRLDDPRLQKERIIDFVVSLQQKDGSFAGDKWGEIDTRFTYCALSTLSILDALDKINILMAAEYIMQCCNLDGGFGCVIGAESHAGQVFCCVGALAIAKCLYMLGDEGIDLLGWWLAERQVDSGGLNGRPEKQSDVCYSWWILSALSIIGKVHWINTDKLAAFILRCQDPDDGGIADRPDDMADVFHTFFGIAGLSLLGHLHKENDAYRRIDPVYALPTDVVRRLNLKAQIAKRRNESLDERLSHYEKYELE